MESIDPATGQPLPPDAIQRVLFIVGTIHVYNIPPMVPGKGHVAALWTAEGNKQPIFTARLRVLETAITQASGDEKVKADIVLEDQRNGQLFAAAPYTAAAVVEPASDSSRFFALRVQDEAGRKATLGIGFEERSDAFDFGVSLQEAQKTLGWAQDGPPGNKPTMERKDSAEKRDLSLKEGETITVNLPARFGRRKPQAGEDASDTGRSSFSLPPPPFAAASGGGSILPPPPPPPSTSSRAKRLSAANLGFDDGKFGEFA
ncbi:putative adaptin ear-binding coat-associated protein 2 protein [Rosellinia necatrix]|uniref:Putative adaptin ear-binding coat-associated protein 2 protein n=1 Tax=Rosellinia necatrix TaxID=77044 RepID=A0A1W2TB12_ROSNE|nr:putative adaptin ear-binding coat-associated protein 2 protein [Rosellinia necatrix]